MITFSGCTSPPPGAKFEASPVPQALASPALKSRHWETLSEKTGSTIEPDEELTLQQLVDTNVGQHIETIHEVC